MFKKYRYLEGLTSLQFNTQGVYINYLGQVKDKLGNDINRQLDEDGHWCVDVDSWGGQRRYRIIDLMAIQFKNILLSKDNLDEIVAFPIDGNNDNLHANNIGYRFRSGKLRALKYPSYYVIPTFTGYGINDDFEVINLKSGNKIKWHITKCQENKNIKGGYRVSAGKTSNGKSAVMLRHRVIGLVFLAYPNNCDGLIVNHKDGIPGNDYPDNLEWITRQENNNHAWETGLRSQNKRVLARNVRTGEITEFYSISEASRRFGFPTDETMRQRIINSPFSFVFREGYQFKLKSDPRDWLIPDDPEEAIKLAITEIPVSVRSCSDLSVRVFNSISSAASFAGLVPSSIKARLVKGDKSPLYGFQFAIRSSEVDWPDFDIETANRKPISSRIGVDARNVFTGETSSYSSIAQACKCHRYNMRWSLQYGEQPYLKNGWQFKKSSDEWSEIGDLEEILYKQQSSVMARSVDDGKVYISSTLRDLSFKLNVSPNWASRAANTRGNMIYEGYQWRRGITDEPWPIVG